MGYVEFQCKNCKQMYAELIDEAASRTLFDGHCKCGAIYCRECWQKCSMNSECFYKSYMCDRCIRCNPDDILEKLEKISKKIKKYSDIVIKDGYYFDHSGRLESHLDEITETVNKIKEENEYFFQ